MHITQEMRQQACEGLLHFTPKKTLARELGVSVGSIRAWAIYIQPKRILFWDVKPETSLGTFRMAIEKLSDIPADRPLTLAERKVLLKEMQDARGRLICAESILEVAIEGCKDELKKKELQRQLELTRKALASLMPVD